jgi:hypothetical protein
MSRLSTKLLLSRQASNYAVLWGLTHDIATWPLSHTGEAAFARSTETDARALRAMMILGSDKLPRALSLYAQIKAASIDHGTLEAIFDKQSIGFDKDLSVVHQLVHSALTPDTIEGMYRSGSVFNVPVPHPRLFVEALERDLYDGARLTKDSSSIVFKFWRGKSKIYSDFINTQRAIEFESTWSRSIQNSFPAISLSDSLALSETEVIGRAVDSVREVPKDVLRYKAPLSYSIAETHKRRRTFDHPVPIDRLSTVFVKEKR